MARVIWTPEALDVLETIRDYLFAVAAEQTSQVLSGIINAVRNLPRFSQSGRPVLASNREELREVVSGNYRIIDRFTHDTVWILRVAHGARDVDEVLRRMRESES